MKLKINTKSIKFKTWLYFVLFAAVLMTTLWVVQVFLLNNFYGTMKTSQTHSVAREIESAFQHNSRKEFVKKVDEISDSYDMYVYVLSYDGITTYYTPSIEDFVLAPGIETHVEEGSEFYTATQQPIGLYASELQSLNEALMKSGDSTYMKFTSPNKSQELLACGKVLTAKDKEDMIVYIFSPLWPVSSTIEILKNQLMIVTIVSLILACLISFYLSLRISTPIRKINRSAKKLAEGEYGIVFGGGHYSELNDLADTLTTTSIELEKSDMLQKDLIANVSHDLRTPLTMVKSYAEMIRDISGNNPEKREEHLQVIINETDRLNALVEDLLAVSRAQSGKMSLDYSTFNISDSIESIINTYKVMEEDGYTIKLDCPSSIFALADEEKIKQVVSNLVSNAIKFCGDDKRITVSLKKHGRFVRCSIKDNGNGIPADELNHIWERYYRSSSNGQRSAEGSGLGLSICKEILSMHKVDFGVDSAVGKGTTFWFNLKMIPTPKNLADNKKSVATKGPAATKKGSSLQ